MNILVSKYFDQPGGMYRELDGITTHFFPKDLSLYQRLLPPPFKVPAQPVVTLFVVNYPLVYRWPVGNYPYSEWSVMLKSEWNGAIGYYPVTIPVSKPMAKILGRYIGFPKYTAAEISLTGNTESCQAFAKHDGIVQVRLEYRKGLTRPLEGWEAELLENESFFKGDAFLLVPPGKGPKVRNIKLIHKTQPKWHTIDGMVRVFADQTEEWAGLVPDIGEFPGTYNHFQGGFNLLAVELE